MDKSKVAHFFGPLCTGIHHSTTHIQDSIMYAECRSSNWTVLETIRLDHCSER